MQFLYIHVSVELFPPVSPAPVQQDVPQSQEPVATEKTSKFSLFVLAVYENAYLLK